MSIQDTLNALVQAGTLYHLEPVVEGESCVRTLFLHQEICSELWADVWQDPQDEERYAKLQGDFDRYITGETIPIGMEPYDKGDNAFMARVDPSAYGIWTIRSVAPSPAIRVFGAFCEQDVFVALLTRKRAALGGRESREWAAARESAVARWGSLFPGFNPLTGDNVNDFFSEKTYVV